ncbi:hypothetical protein MKR28_01520 [Staphylococcus haemolyticus]|uniref:hypothetical protein n=1 Tax=Staphylococcus haemolyticus TaxID=1283 RepID=UPI001F0A285A|nr:hypothetical protein [Staphylococcus haemolyticus]MCH4459105.1 hypothetical protein [Staphylococcus haemolyticus]
MDKKLLKKYFDNNDYKAIAIVVGSKKMVLENDIHLDYENEIIIYPLKNCTRIIPFSSISYIDLLEENEHFINYFKETV